MAFPSLKAVSMALITPNHVMTNIKTASATLGLAMNRITALDSLMIVLWSLRKNFIIPSGFFRGAFFARDFLACLFFA